MKPKTIKEAIMVLQESISAAIPDMDVTVNISLSADDNSVSTKIIQDIPEDLAKAIDLAALRSYLNAYVKKAGAKEALILVGKYTDGSKDAADIPVEKYADLVKEISKKYPKMVLSFKEKDEA